MSVFVFHTPEQVPNGIPSCAVAVDVLRATTTIATALSAGAEAVQVFADLDLLRQTSADWPAQARLLAGERGGKTVTGFDLGNSPLDCTPERVGGKRIFMSTTNGTRSLQRVQAAPVVLTAAFVNLPTVLRFLQDHAFETIWVVGSGWEGSFSLEDTACAGAIAAAFEGAWGNDEAIAAAALYRRWQDDLVGLLHRSSHGQRLLQISSGHKRDLEFCATIGSVDRLPRQKQPGLLCA